MEKKQENDTDILLSVSNLKQYFSGNRKSIIKAVDGVSLEIHRGETYGLVGESGSGKTTIGRAIIRIYNPIDGKIVFDNTEISGNLNRKKRRFITDNIQMIFQDPMACLNPRKKVGDIIAQGLDIRHAYKTRAERNEKVYAVLEKVGLSREHINRYPHQFSGGQRQRIGIARAIIMNPKLIIADEAISALDVSIQAQIVNLLKSLQKELETTLLFIAHDLAMVKYISDRIGVLHLGHMVESGTMYEIFHNPIHPYTKSLLSAIPHPNPKVEKSRKTIEYDYYTSGIDYNKGILQHIAGQHYVLATSEELLKWTENIISNID